MGKPGSKSIRKFYAHDKRYFITIVEWNGEYGQSFEVGLRDLKTTEFKLVASYIQNKDKALLIGSAVQTLVENGWTGEEINELFPGLFG